MRTTKKVLEAKVNNYNSISNVKLKLNDDVVGAINLYTEDNNRIATDNNSIKAVTAMATASNRKEVLTYDIF